MSLNKEEINVQTKDNNPILTITIYNSQKKSDHDIYVRYGAALVIIKAAKQDESIYQEAKKTLSNSIKEARCYE